MWSAAIQSKTEKKENQIKVQKSKNSSREKKERPLEAAIQSKTVTAAELT